MRELECYNLRNFIVKGECKDLETSDRSWIVIKFQGSNTKKFAPATFSKFETQDL